MVIAITGGIGCGKTTALEYIKNKGYLVYNADKISHNILEQEEIKKTIYKEISKEVFINSNIDRKKLGEIIFSDNEKFEKLNNIMQPKILEKMLEYINKINEKEIVFFEVPILFEMKLETYFDKVMVIYANKDTQIKRVKNRDKLDNKNILNRLNRQIDIDEKKKKADIVIENMGDISEFKRNIDKLLGELDENK